MYDFIYSTLPHRVLFGPGKRALLRQEVERLGCRRALVLSTPGRQELARELAGQLGELSAGVHAGAAMHTPQETITATLEVVRTTKADLLVAPGGGSTIGLAKGVAREMQRPILALPTTYSGSEMTAIWGVTRGGVKETGIDPAVKPATVIYDPALLVGLPVPVSTTSGMNAMAHAVEALYAAEANPVSSMMAEAGIAALAAGLPQVAADPADLGARAQTLYGAWLAATVLGAVGMALHHKLCHTLGGSFGLPHAELHTVILPYATAYNASHAPAAMAVIGRALGVEAAGAAGGLFDLNVALGNPLNLKSLGFARAEVARAAALALQNQYANPRPLTLAGITELLLQAYEGHRP